jgi:hypothetical protein
MVLVNDTLSNHLTIGYPPHGSLARQDFEQYSHTELLVQTLHASQGVGLVVELWT